MKTDEEPVQYAVVGIAFLLGNVRVYGPFASEAEAFARATAMAALGWSYHVCPIEGV